MRQIPKDTSTPSLTTNTSTNGAAAPPAATSPTSSNNIAVASKKGNDKVMGSPNIFKELWKTVEHPEEKLSLLIFQFLFQIIIDVITEQVEAWMYSEPQNNNSLKTLALNESTVLALLLVRVLFKHDYCGMLIPCFFRTMIVKSGLMAKFRSHLYLKK